MTSDHRTQSASLVWQRRLRSIEGSANAPVCMPRSLNALRVFLVEDSALIRERLGEDIASAGRIDVVGYAETEAEAVAALHERQCDVIILDLDLRQGNGFEVLKSVRADPAGPRPLVIVFTNYVYPHYRSQSVRLGADYFFDKARDFDRVREVIEDLARA